MTVSGNPYGVYIIQDDDIGAAGDEQTYLAGADADGVDVVVRVDQDVSAGGVEVYAHPLSPAGTYYSSPTGVAMATAIIDIGAQAVIMHIDNRPCNVFGISVVNNDVITHNLDIVLYGNAVN